MITSLLNPSESLGSRDIPVTVLVVACLLIVLIIVSVSVASAGSNSLTVGATVISKSNCKFNSAASALNFGAIDPNNTTDVVKTTSVNFVCHGSAPIATYAISTDDGRYESGPGAYRMRNASLPTEYLPYSLSLSPTSGTVAKNATQTLTITGTVTSQNYGSAYAGNYADTVVISLIP
jgi:hypothetical protein